MKSKFKRIFPRATKQLKQLFGATSMRRYPVQSSTCFLSLAVLFNLFICSSTGCTDENVSEMRKNLGHQNKVRGIEINYQNDLKNTVKYLPHLHKLDELQILLIGGYKFPATELKHIWKTKQIVKLSIVSTNFTSNDLAGIKELNNLRELKIDHNDIIDDTLFEHLAELSIEKITIENCAKITGKNIDMLIKNDSLQELKLAGTNLNDDATISLAKMQQLRTLHVNETKITDVGIKKLLELVNVADLSLPNTNKENWVPFAKYALELRHKARAEGKPTTPDNLAPFYQVFEK